MTVADTPTVAFGAAEQTLNGADELALAISDHALGDQPPGAAAVFFASAAHELLSVLVFCAAHGESETSRTVEEWLSTAAGRTTEFQLLQRLRTMVDARIETGERGDPADPRRAMQRLVKWMGTDRTAQAVQATAILAVREWAAHTTKERAS